jgi:hypothetical protein
VGHPPVWMVRRWGSERVYGEEMGKSWCSCLLLSWGWGRERDWARGADGHVLFLPARAESSSSSPSIPRRLATPLWKPALDNDTSHASSPDLTRTSDEPATTSNPVDLNQTGSMVRPSARAAEPHSPADLRRLHRNKNEFEPTLPQRRLRLLHDEHLPLKHPSLFLPHRLFPIKRHTSSSPLPHSAFPLTRLPVAQKCRSEKTSSRTSLTSDTTAKTITPCPLARSSNARETAVISTGYTNASSARAAPPCSPPTGGTRTSTCNAYGGASVDCGFEGRIHGVEEGDPAERVESV